jgi:hypothetical protein
MHHDFYLSNYNFTIGCLGFMEIVTIVLVEGTRSIELNNKQAGLLWHVCLLMFSSSWVEGEKLLSLVWVWSCDL